jgi:hypothetical protein
LPGIDESLATSKDLLARVSGKHHAHKSCAGSRNARLRRRSSGEELVYGLVWNSPAQTQEKPVKAIPIFRARVHDIDLNVARAPGRERSAEQPTRLIVSFSQ